MNERGVAAENNAAEFLQRQGLRLLARNWRCAYGEIDLIMCDGETLVFVEVRQRASSNFGGAAASIGAAKQRRWVASAQAYLQTLTHIPSCRFDAVCFEGNEMHWLKNCM